MVGGNMGGRKEPLSEELALASDVFDKFCNAPTLKLILGHHRHLCELLRIKPTHFPNFYPKLKSKLCSWKAQALWTKFDKRASHKCYNRGKACPNTRVLVIGAGPCGMRAAIEAQLLGAKVVVVEKRDRLSRNNVLHLWPFVIHDLRALGAKKFFGKFCAGAIDHISIRQLQCLMLKIALLLGVEIHEGVGFEGLVPPPEDQNNEKIGWRAEVSPPDHPVSQYEFDVLIGADGKRNTLEGKLAIAITVNFINRRTKAEARVEEISGVAFIFNQKFFKDLLAETGIDLENIVYYKDETHYFVMTAKKPSLINKGVIIKDFQETAKLLASENVDKDALQKYAREAADFSTNYQLPDLEFAVNHYGQPDVAMFDFTSMFAAENASRVIERRGHKLLLTLVGDSLLEPFWPTGSGCARGFLSSMDACWAIKSWGSGQASVLEVLAERESIYRILAQTTPENLQRDYNGYTLDPYTRYTKLNHRCVTPSQVRGYFDTDDPAFFEEPFDSTLLLSTTPPLPSTPPLIPTPPLTSTPPLIPTPPLPSTPPLIPSLPLVPSPHLPSSPLASTPPLVPSPLTFTPHLVSSPLASTPHLVPSPLASTPHLVPSPLASTPHLVPSPLASTPHLVPSPLASTPHLVPSPLASTPHLVPSPLASTPHLVPSPLASTPHLVPSPLASTPHLVPSPLASTPHLVPSPLASTPHLVPSPLASTPHLVPSPLASTPHLVPSPLASTPHLVPSPLASTPHLVSSPLASTPHLVSSPLASTPHLVSSPLAFTPHDMPKKRRRKDSQVHPDSLLLWLKKQVALYKDVEVEDMTHSFKNGMVLCAVIHRYRPDLIDFHVLHPDDVVVNNQLAFDTLERELGIPPMMTGQEMEQCEVPDRLKMLAYLSQIYDTFRGEIPHIKYPKLDESEGKHLELIPMIPKYPVKKADPSKEQMVHLLGRITSQHHHRPSPGRKRNSTEREPAVPSSPALAGGDRKIDSLRRPRKRRSTDKERMTASERRRIIEEIDRNRMERMMRRKYMRHLATQQFYKSMQMLHSNERSDPTPHEDYSLFVYRQTAPPFEDRVKEMENKILYPDREARLRAEIKAEMRKGGTDEDFTDRIKTLEEKLKGIPVSQKKPKDLLRAIGKIEKTDWNVKEIEKKIEENKMGRSSKHSRAEKVPKWSREQFDDKFQAVKMKLQKKSAVANPSDKYNDVDVTLKRLDKKIKEGSAIELGPKVSVMAEQFAVRTQEPDKPTLQRSNSKAALFLPTQGSSETCHFCAKRVYLMERMNAEGKLFHRGCFRCEYCNISLRLGNYGFDRDGKFGSRFFCMQHFGMKGTHLLRIRRRSEELKSVIDKENIPAITTPKIPIKAKSLCEEAAKLISPDMLDSMSTPERIEFENLAGAAQDVEETPSEMDEDEWTDRNFGASAAEGSSDDDMSDSEDEEEDVANEVFEEAIDQPVPVTADATRRLAETWTRRYSKNNDESETATEGEDDIIAREQRKQEVRLEVPQLPRGRKDSDTGSDTEIASDEYTSTESESEEVENSATEIETDSEFEHDGTTPTHEIPAIMIDDSNVTRRKHQIIEEPKKVQVRTSHILRPINGTVGKPSNKPQPSQEPIGVKLKFSPLRPETDSGKSTSLSNLTAGNNIINASGKLPATITPTPFINPRRGDYFLNRTHSTEGIASKLSLELKKKYLFGNSGFPGSVKKSGSATTLDSKVKSFVDIISEHQKLLHPAPEPSPTMQAFLQGTSKLSVSSLNNNPLSPPSPTQLNPPSKPPQTPSPQSTLNLRKQKDLPFGEDSFEHVCNLGRKKDSTKQMSSLSEHSEKSSTNSSLNKLLASLEPSLITNGSKNSKLEHDFLDAGLKKNESGEEMFRNVSNRDNDVDMVLAVESTLKQNEQLVKERKEKFSDYVEEQEADCRPRSPAHETSIVVPEVLWKVHPQHIVDEDDIESDSLSSSDSASELEGGESDDNSESPSPVRERTPPRVEIHDSSGELMVEGISAQEKEDMSEKSNIDKKTIEVPSSLSLDIVSAMETSTDFIKTLDSSLSERKLSSVTSERSSPSTPPSMRGEDSESYHNEATLAETELSDWAQDADVVVSEDLEDVEFNIDPDYASIRRQRKAKNVRKGGKVLAARIARGEDFGDFDDPGHICGLKKEDKSELSLHLNDFPNNVTSRLLSGMENIEFMDMADENDSETDEVLAATNSTLLKNRGYVKFVNSFDEDDLVTPIVETQTMSDHLPQISSTPTVLLTECEKDADDASDSPETMELLSHSEAVNAELVMCSAGEAEGTTTEETTTSEVVTIKDSPIDATPQTPCADDRFYTPKPNASQFLIGNLNESTLVEDVSKKEYEEYVQRLEGRMSAFSNVRDSIDIRKSRRKNKPVPQKQEKIVEDPVDDSNNQDPALNSSMDTPSTSQKLEVISRERLKQKDLIHEMVMNKLLTQKKNSQDKKVKRSHGSITSPISSPGFTPIKNPFDSLPQSSENKYDEKFKFSETVKSPLVEDQKDNILNKSEVPLSNDSFTDDPEKFYTPLTSFKKRISTQLRHRPVSVHASFKSHRMGNSFEKPILPDTPLTNPEAFSLPDIRKALFKSPDDVFRTPVPPPRTRHEEGRRLVERERQREEARSRARLKSDEELGLSPEDYIKSLKQKVRYKGSQSSSSKHPGIVRCLSEPGNSPKDGKSTEQLVEEIITKSLPIDF
uniref:F-actin monooxygenase n=1 Tax=Timema californicum TaxID=61474 RepID=A0A7R9P2I6_TIMCA|nr:unnamed protein product [Timema californicum]